MIESEWFQALFSDAFQIREDANRTDEYHTSSFGFRKAVGIDGAITGKGGEIILLDDPQDPSRAESENRRESVIDYYNKTLYNRLDNIQVGLRIIIQQRLHEQDLTGYLLEKNPEDYTHICLPAESSEHVSPETLKAFYQDNLLDPVRFPKPELEKLKRNLGSTAYSGQNGQNPVPSDGLIFKRDWFPVLSLDQFRDLIGTRIIPMNIVIDSAYTNNPDNDPSAFMAYYKFDNHIYVKNVATKWLEFNELVKYIVEFALDNGVTSQSRVYVEEAASGKSLIQHINKTNRNLNVIGIPKPRLSKEQRAFSITPDTEAKKVQLIQGICTDDFLNEVCAFPKAKHDDRVDCLLQAVEKSLKHSGEWDFRFS